MISQFQIRALQELKDKSSDYRVRKRDQQFIRKAPLIDVKASITVVSLCPFKNSSGQRTLMNMVEEGKSKNKAIFFSVHSLFLLSMIILKIISLLAASNTSLRRCRGVLRLHAG